jgi:hypothetical protein
MKLNTAVCFALLGAAMIALTQERHRPALVWAWWSRRSRY